MSACSVVTISSQHYSVDCVKVKPGYTALEISTLLDSHPHIQALIYSPKGKCNFSELRNFFSTGRCISYLGIKTPKGSSLAQEEIDVIRNGTAFDAITICTGVFSTMFKMVYIGRQNVNLGFLNVWYSADALKKYHLTFCDGNCSLSMTRYGENYMRLGSGCTADEIVQFLAKFPDVKCVTFSPKEHWNETLESEFLKKNKQINHFSIDTGL